VNEIAEAVAVLKIRRLVLAVAQVVMVPDRRSTGVPLDGICGEDHTAT